LAVGCRADLMDIHLRDLNGNYNEGKIINIDTHNTMILSHNNSKVIATVGLDNFIIVTTENAIVIVPKGRSEDVKKNSGRIRKYGN
jgi:mannose-1-phosphate guanylyltransferase